MSADPRVAAWLTDDEQRAWRGLLHMHAELTARLGRDLLERSGLSNADYEVLVNLSETRQGRLRAYELCAAMTWEKSRLSHHLTRMERRGLVRRDECATDARGAYVSITDAGATAINDAAPHHVASVRRFFIEALTAAQLQSVTTISSAVVAAVATHD